ncbi:hypothetical protein [Paenibacillus humicus]|uniref:hypothetical protein n=1 Tax=Paenibacillus humicus TaxID=412861 RepID=UPI003D2C6D1F
MNEASLNGLLEDFEMKVTKRYKIDQSTLRDVFLDCVQKNIELAALIERENDIKKIKRTKIYSKFENSLKKKIYMDLRRYYQNKEEIEEKLSDLFEARSTTLTNKTMLTDDPLDPLQNLLLSHVSTKERIHDCDILYDTLSPYLDNTDNIIDIGCGIHPLLAYRQLKKELSSLRHYIAIDKDQTSIKIVNSFAELNNQQSLIAHKWDLAGGWNDLYKITGIKQYDFAFMMKLLPLLSKQNRELVSNLKQTPAKFILVTGSKTSLTKKINIEKRESAIINDFIQNVGWKKVHKINLSEEFGWIVQTNLK